MKSTKINPVLNEEEIESILIPVILKVQEIIMNGGYIITTICNDSFSLEGDSCEFIACEGYELEMHMQYNVIVIPLCKYISGEDLDSYNPVLHFQDISVEFDMCDEEDC